ncbi:MAG: hypothetical protein KJ767_03215 [Nanoarchaeota archaeon]|nr:hypothetical protein [Nanoarchaeota archaeon]
MVLLITKSEDGFKEAEYVKPCSLSYGGIKEVKDAEAIPYKNLHHVYTSGISGNNLEEIVKESLEEAEKNACEFLNIEETKTKIGNSTLYLLNYYI